MNAAPQGRSPVRTSSRARAHAPLLATTVLGALLVTRVEAQVTLQPHEVLRQHDLVPGLGELALFLQTTLNDAGTVLAEVQPEGSSESFVLRDGFPTIKAGVTLPVPAGYRIQPGFRFAPLALNTANTIVWPLAIDDPLQGTASRTLGLYTGVDLLHLAGDPVAREVVDPDGMDLSAYVYQDFRWAKINDAHQVLWLGEIAQGSDVKLVLGRIDTDGAGTILAEEVLLRTDMAFEETTVRTIASRSTNAAMNNRGEWIAVVQLADRAVAADTVFVVDGAGVAAEGQASPFADHEYGNHLAARVGINDFGDYVFTTNVKMGNALVEVLLVNASEVVSAENSLALGLASISPDTISGYGPPTGPLVDVANSGDVFWYGDLSGAGQRNRALFRNQEVLVREGDTLPNGEGVRTVEDGPGAFAAAPSGRYWIGQVQYTGSRDQALVLFDFGTTLPVPGRGVNAGTLTKVGGDARVGGSLDLELGNPQGDGVLPFLFLSQGPAIPGSPLGIATGFGELLVDPGRLLATLRGDPVEGGRAPFGASIPADPALVEVQGWIQGLFLDASAGSAGEGVRLTNGLFVELGAP